MTEFIFFIGGMVTAKIISILFKRNEKIYGIIEVDHDSGMCGVRITSDELSDYKSKKAVFEIKHDGVISREEQGL